MWCVRIYRIYIYIYTYIHIHTHTIYTRYAQIPAGGGSLTGFPRIFRGGTLTYRTDEVKRSVFPRRFHRWFHLNGWKSKGGEFGKKMIPSGLQFWISGFAESLSFWWVMLESSAFRKKFGMSSCPGLAMVGGLFPRQHRNWQLVTQHGCRGANRFFPAWVEEKGALKSRYHRICP